MYCQKCGAQLPEGSAFCPSCGASANEQQPVYQPRQPSAQPQQPFYAQQGSAPNAQPTYSQPAYSQNAYQPTYQPSYSQNAAAPALPMRWFKFLIYFALFASALLNLVNGIKSITGAQYGDEKELVYAFFESLKAIDVIMGILCIGLAAFTVYVRFRLAAYKADGPKLLIIMYIAVLAIDILYLIAVAFAISKSGVGIGDLLSGSVIGTLIGSVVMLIVNKIYFDKRKALFVN